MKSIFLAGFILGMCQIVYAQEDHKHQTEGHEEEHKEHQEEHHKHMISLVLGHAHVSKGVENERTTWLVLPAWALDYNHFINPKWAVGLHTDMIIGNFEVKSNSGGDGGFSIERSNPMSFVGVVSYKPLHYLAVILGSGVEYAPEETFTLFRVGIEPSIELSDKYEVIFNMSYDFKIDAYNNWNLGVGIARLF